jgi:NAD(P)-dependent dehydrogenase (short-subunit alcohol dehydrogenase family)
MRPTPSVQYFGWHTLTHTANSLVQAGCSKVYLIARSASDVEAAAVALNSLESPNKDPDAEAIPIVGDISNVDECERLAAEVAKTTNHVDILITNAGATFIGQFDDYKEADFAEVMKVNVNSVFFTVQKWAIPLTPFCIIY